MQTFQPRGRRETGKEWELEQILISKKGRNLPSHGGLWRVRTDCQARREGREGMTCHAGVLSSPGGSSGVGSKNHAPFKLHGHDSGLRETRKGGESGPLPIIQHTQTFNDPSVRSLESESRAPPTRYQKSRGGPNTPRSTRIPILKSSEAHPGLNSPPPRVPQNASVPLFSLPSTPTALQHLQDTSFLLKQSTPPPAPAASSPSPLSPHRSIASSLVRISRTPGVSSPLWRLPGFPSRGQ